MSLHPPHDWYIPQQTDLRHGPTITSASHPFVKHVLLSCAGTVQSGMSWPSTVVRLSSVFSIKRSSDPKLSGGTGLPHTVSRLVSPRSVNLSTRPAVTPPSTSLLPPARFDLSPLDSYRLGGPRRRDGIDGETLNCAVPKASPVGLLSNSTSSHGDRRSVRLSSNLSHEW